MKLQKGRTNYFVGIPMDLIKLTGWEKGQQLVVVPGKDGCLEIRKV